MLLVCVLTNPVPTIAGDIPLLDNICHGNTDKPRLYIYVYVHVHVYVYVYARICIYTYM